MYLYIPLAAHAAVSGLRSASGGLHLCALTCQITEPCHLLKVGEECFQLLTNLAGFFAPHLFICGGSRFRCGGGGGGGGEALPWHRALSAPVRQPTNAAKQRQAGLAHLSHWTGRLGFQLLELHCIKKHIYMQPTILCAGSMSLGLEVLAESVFL